MAGVGSAARVDRLGKPLRNKGPFPNLTDENHYVNSFPAQGYNCIAWAAGDCSRRWWPIEVGGYFWPETPIPPETLESFIRAFNSLGYSISDNADVESGKEKVAIYTDDSEKPKHAARQVEDGSWASKLGGLEDIIHHDLTDLSNSSYGSVATVLSRPGQLPSVDDLAKLARGGSEVTRVVDLREVLGFALPRRLLHRV